MEILGMDLTTISYIVNGLLIIIGGLFATHINKVYKFLKQIEAALKDQKLTKEEIADLIKSFKRLW